MFFSILKSKDSNGVSALDRSPVEGTKPFRRVPFAPVLVLPLGQHLGAPSRPIVSPGQEVVRGEPIAEPEGSLSVALHAPATGVIQSIGETRNAAGELVRAIFLKVYKAAGQEILYGAPVNVEALSPEELAEAVRDAGIVDLEAPGLPTHAKLALPDRRKIDTIIANACDSESHPSADYRLLVERRTNLFLGLRIALKASRAARAVIAVESGKTDLVKALEQARPADLPVSIEAVTARYPLGSDNVIIKSVLGRKVPDGGLPIDVGVAVIHAATLADMGDLLPRHGGLIERVITVSGAGIQKPGNYLVPFGTPLSFLLKHVGATPEAAQVFFGGPMTGTTVENRDVPITKDVSGILVLTAEAVRRVNGRSLPTRRAG